MTIFYRIVASLLLVSFIVTSSVHAQKKKLVDVGVGRMEITPVTPVRLAGYSDRNVPFTGVSQKLWSKALAFGSAKHGYSVLLTVDLLGIPAQITQRVREELAKEINIKPENLVICASHTHSGPQIGNILSHFHKPLDEDELAEVALYGSSLILKLKEVALQAIKDIQPSTMDWGTGEVTFAVNRRKHHNPNGPVDHSMPLLRIASPDGKVRAVLVSYACHAVTFGPSNNTVHGDWVGEAQLQIEKNIPGTIALVAVGCGADQNSNPRMNKDIKVDFQSVEMQGKSIANEVTRLLASNQLKPVTAGPSGKLKSIELAFANAPDPKELARKAKESGRESNYSRLILNRMARSEDLPMKINYPIQLWSFGNDLSMLFMAGEVVVDYALRLKKEVGTGKLWINAYSNDMPCYIPSQRVLNEGGYEAEGAMAGYEKPSRFKDGVEEQIIEAVHELLPKKR